MAYIVMACVGMVNIVTTYIVMACMNITYVAMAAARRIACIAMAGKGFVDN